MYACKNQTKQYEIIGWPYFVVRLRPLPFSFARISCGKPRPACRWSESFAAVSPDCRWFAGGPRRYRRWNPTRCRNRRWYLSAVGGVSQWPLLVCPEDRRGLNLQSEKRNQIVNGTETIAKNKNVKIPSKHRIPNFWWHLPFCYSTGSDRSKRVCGIVSRTDETTWRWTGRLWWMQRRIRTPNLLVPSASTPCW